MQRAGSTQHHVANILLADLIQKLWKPTESLSAKDLFNFVRLRVQTTACLTDVKPPPHGSLTTKKQHVLAGKNWYAGTSCRPYCTRKKKKQAKRVICEGKVIRLGFLWQLVPVVELVSSILEMKEMARCTLKTELQPSNTKYACL